jgi:hypothetical protein
MLVAVLGFGSVFLLRTFVSVSTSFLVGSVGGGFYLKQRYAKHVVVVGSFSFPIVKRFVEEIYNEDHGDECADLNCVIMFLPGMEEVMEATKLWLKRSPDFLHKVWLIQGSALLPDDLDRAACKDCTMVFVLPNISTRDAEREDLDNVMRALAIYSHAPFVRIVCMLLKAELRDLMLAVGVKHHDIISLDEMKMSLLGKACDTKCFGVLAYTLVKSMNCGFQLSDDPWVEHYLHGLGNELYEQPLSPAYFGAPFCDVALDILQRSDGKAYLVGTIEEPIFPGDETITRFHPGRYHRCGADEDRNCVGVFIAHERQAIVQHPPDSKFSWSMGDKVKLREVEGMKHPNAVPTLIDAGPATYTNPVTGGIVDEASMGILKDRYRKTPGPRGYVFDPFKRMEEQEALVKDATESAAMARCAQGLQNRAGKSIGEIGLILGKQVQVRSGGMDDLLADEDAAEQQAQGADVKGLALLSMQKKAQTDAMKEAAEMAREKRRRENRVAMAKLSKQIAVIERHEELEHEQNHELPTKEEQEEEDALWCGAPDPVPALPGNPKEPPVAVLHRGGHVLVVAIESSAEPAKKKKHNDSAKTGGKLGLHHFVRALRVSDPTIPRPVVVLAQKVPLDWHTVANEEEVYLMIGRPLSGASLRRAHLHAAHAVVIHHDGKADGKDEGTVDAETIFATRVVDAILSEENKDILVICDVALESSSCHVPMSKHERVRASAFMVLEDLDDDEREKRSTLEDTVQTPFHMELRFITGQLFSSNLMVSMVANLLYNPMLGCLMKEIADSKCTIIPVPNDFKGHSFSQLFEFLMRKRDLMAVALLRRQDEHVEATRFHDDGEEEEEVEAPLKAPERWSPEEPAWRHYLFCMPEGDRLVAEHDGIMCIIPKKITQLVG